MNRLLIGLLTTGMAVLATVLGGAEASAQQRFAYINSQRLIMEAPGTSEAQRAFEADMANYRAELERLEAELDSLQANFERQQTTLSAAVREQRQLEMQQKFIAYQQRTVELEETAQRRQAELVGPIMQRIEQAVDAVRAEGGYSMIFDVASGALVAADPALDLTDQILTRLRATAANP
jgi:outer membrane protein